MPRDRIDRGASAAVPTLKHATCERLARLFAQHVARRVAHVCMHSALGLAKGMGAGQVSAAFPGL